MKDTEKMLEDIINALDGHTAATSKEAELILQTGYLPVDEFMKKVKATAKIASEAESAESGTPGDINIDENNI